MLVAKKPDDFSIPKPKEPGSRRQDNTLSGQLIKRWPRLIGRVELENRFRPQSTLLQLFLNKAIDTLVPDADEALDVLFVVGNYLFSKREDINALLIGTRIERGMTNKSRSTSYLYYYSQTSCRRAKISSRTNNASVSSVNRKNLTQRSLRSSVVSVLRF
jgi:hypothetical protein